MATLTASPPPMSPPLDGSAPSPPSLPPLITTANTTTQNIPHRPASWTSRRMSPQPSSTLKAAQSSEVRSSLQSNPGFQSSLPYTLVRDFAYPSNHPLHYGASPDQSGMSTPVSDARRMSDPAIASWEDSRSSWSATPKWMAETDHSHLPATAFNDGGPPYSEDEDIQSPIVTTSRHKKHKSSAGHERGRSPGAAGPLRSVFVGRTGFDPGNENGPGGAVDTYPGNGRSYGDSGYADSDDHDRSYNGQSRQSEYYSENDDDDRFSKDYSFTIASPAEECHGKAVALFDFESEHQNELPLKEGQIILVSYRQSQGWLVAEDPRTGENGLVPEEFVRLVRDIEGGLNGLNSVTLEDGDGDGSLGPVSNDTGSARTPTATQPDFPHHVSKSSNGSNPGERHPPIQSTFSTSSRDFSPRPRPSKSDESSGVRSIASVQEGQER